MGHLELLPPGELGNITPYLLGVLKRFMESQRELAFRGAASANAQHGYDAPPSKNRRQKLWQAYTSLISKRPSIFGVRVSPRQMECLCRPPPALWQRSTRC